MRSNKNILIISLVLLGLVIVGLLALYYLNKQKEAPAKPKDVTSSAQVNITSKDFSPASITINQGSVVVFTNQDSNPHQVASDPHPTHTSLEGFESTVLTKGDSYSFVFEKSGTFTYHDHLNPLILKGTIIVK